MNARVDKDSDGRPLGMIELTPEDGYHAGTTVGAWVNDDGWVVVQIDTPGETETHEMTWVYLNDARPSGWEAA